jgi:hypothetical protein
MSKHQEFIHTLREMKNEQPCNQEDVIETADRLVNQDRQEAYGHPFDDFSRTAKMMTGIGFRFTDPKLGIREIEAKDIPIFMILVKLSREANTHKEDNIVDTIGYAKTLKQVHDEMERRKSVPTHPVESHGGKLI